MLIRETASMYSARMHSRGGQHVMRWGIGAAGKFSGLGMVSGAVDVKLASYSARVKHSHRANSRWHSCAVGDMSYNGSWEQLLAVVVV